MSLVTTTINTATLFSLDRSMEGVPPTLFEFFEKTKRIRRKKKVHTALLSGAAEI